MIRTVLSIVVAGTLGWGPWAARGQTSNEPPANPPAAEEASEAQAGSMEELTGADAGVEVLADTIALAFEKARTRLIEDRYDDAVRMAWAGLEGVDRLPPGAGRPALSQPFVELIVDARLERAGGLDAAAKWKDDAVVGPLRTAFTEALDRARTLSPRPGPSRPAATQAEHLARDERRFREEADLTRAYKADEADLLARGGESRRIPRDVVTFPDDWDQLADRRQPYRDGILYEGPAERNDQGELVQTVVYDIRSLVSPALNFHYIPMFDLHAASRNTQDREALRRGSEIFNGYPHDLAAGIPLLDFFGGVGDWPATITDGQQEYEELMRLIQDVADAPSAP